MIEILLVSQLILWVLVAGLAVTVLLLARQIGVLHERVAPVGALMTDTGAAVGEPVPVMEVRDLGGRLLRIGGAAPNGRDLLLLFVAPSCPVCKKLLPVAKRFARSEQRSLDILFVGDGEREEQERFVRAHGLDGFSYVIAPMVGMRLQVGRLPYAVLIGADGTIRAKGLVNSREHLESLLVAKETGHASIQAFLAAQDGDRMRTTEAGREVEAAANVR